MATGTEASQQANRAGMDPRRLVVIFYLVGTVILALFFGHVIKPIWGNFGLHDAQLIGEDWTTTNVIGAALAAAVAVGCYLHPRTKTLSLECASELMKVTWPSWGETRVSTFAVVIASLVAAVVLFAIDAFSYRMMIEWLPAAWTWVNGH